MLMIMGNQPFEIPTTRNIQNVAANKNCEFYMKEFSRCFDHLEEKKHLPLDFCSNYINAYTECNTINSGRKTNTKY